MKLVHCLILVVITFEYSYGMSSFTKASVKFSLNFFRTAYRLDPSKNCVVSPIAIQRSFAMLHHVARGDVSEQMETLLGLPKNHSLQNDLNNRALEMITKVFHSEFELKPDLLPELQAEHDVNVQGLDFSHPQRIIRAVNQWAALAMNRRVSSVFSTQGLADDANLIMINTIILNTSWKTRRSTTCRSFKYMDRARTVQMMQITNDYRFAQINDLQILELPYEKDTDLSMLIIKSESRSLANVIKKFNLKTYRLIDKRLSNSELEWDVPKFVIKTELEAKRVLDALGLSSFFSKDAFEVFADFTSKLANVYQVLKFGINENGTRGAAGSSKVVKLDDDDEEEVEEQEAEEDYRNDCIPVSTPAPALSRYVVDGPFMFLVRKNSSKDIIFIGHYSRREEWI